MARDGRTHGTRNLVVVLLLVPCMFLGFLLSIVLTDDAARPVCNASGAAVVVDPSTVPAGPIAGYGRAQLVNAAQIMLAAQKLGLTVRDQQIGVMTSMAESSLTVLNAGDAAGPDSRGLFQQRANGAWGTLADRMDPFISATNFFKVEMTIAGREALEPTLVAHRVQSNADPYHYVPYWGPAQAVVQALGGVKAATDSTGSSGVPGEQKNAAGTHYATAGIKPQTAAVANTVGPMFHIKTILGYRPNAGPHDDTRYGHATGLAVDFMVDDIPDGTKVGYSVAKYLQDHASDLGVQYIIWHQQIWSPHRADEGWRPMSDRGSPTQNHMDHVHLSLNGRGGTDLPPGGGMAGCPVDNTADGTTGQVGTVSQTGWAKPANGPMTSPFGMRTNPVTGIYKLHSGIDIGAPCYAPIYASNAGTVTEAGAASGYGNIIAVDHGGGVTTRYAHMYNDGLLVHVGDRVTAGQHIGKVGSVGNSTGCHLHFEVKRNGQFLDPAEFLKQVHVTIG